MRTSRGGADYLGLDISLYALEKARAADLKAVCCDIETGLPFSDGRFDLVLCFEVLEHVVDVQKVTKEMRRVLKPGGKLIASVPNAVYFRERLLFLCGRLNLRGTPQTSSEAPWQDPHLRLFTADTLKKMLLKTGFADIHILGEGFRGLYDLAGFCCLPRLFANHLTLQAARMFSFLERMWPSLFAANIYALARKPGQDK